MPQWVFAKLDPAAARRDPNETQLFKAEQAGEGEYAGTDALVREILQNSMDARSGNGPVRVRLALHPSQELPAAKVLSEYFARLESPLQHRSIAFHKSGRPELSNGFMVCEDFGTRGLGGDPLLSTDPSPGSNDRQDFFWFWRNIGRSGKTGDDLGRWGLGKTVYRAASRVGCMLGLTVRETDRRQLLMGQAVLRIHRVNGVEYAPEGYWCSDQDKKGLPLPIEDASQLQLFRSQWKLTRKNEPGLSVVVPYVADELTGQRLMQAVCVNFFTPILRGELIVDVLAPDIPLGEIRLDASSLDSCCHMISWDGPRRSKRHMAPPISFVTSVVRSRVTPRSTLLLGETKMPEMTERAFHPKDLLELRESVEREQLVAVRVRVNLHRTRENDTEGELTVWLQRQQPDLRCETYYVREGMTITKLNSKAALKGIQALVLVEKGPLAQLLGDSEGPAHEDWDTSAEGPDRSWKKWKGRVTFCRKIVDSLLEVLAPPSRKADFNLLSDFFSVEKIQAPQKARRPDDSGTKDSKFKGIVAKPRWFRLDPKRGGFRVVANSAQEIPENAELSVSVAYDVPDGNPLKKWSCFDFDFKAKPDRIAFRGEHVKVKTTAGNILQLSSFAPGFWFAAEGFDTHTDLFIRIDEPGESTIDSSDTDVDGEDSAP